MINTAKHPWPLLLLLLASACTNMQHRCIQLPQSKGQYCLQPSTDVAPFDVQQQVNIQYKNINEMMIADLEVSASGLQFVTLTPLGQKLMQINDDNFKISSSELGKSPLEPVMLVGLLQLAFWPSNAVEKGLRAPLIMNESSQTRTLLSKDKVILTIQYADKLAPYNQMHINMPLIDFSLEIKKLPQDTGSDAQ